MTKPSMLPRKVVNPPEVEGVLAGALLLSGALVVAIMVLVSTLTGWSPSPLTWYVARASGLVLYLLTWFVMILGIGLTTRLFNRFGGRGVVFSLHAFTFHLWYGFFMLHILSLAIDPTVNFGPRQLFVPFTTDVREPWTSLGIIGAEIAIIVGASFAIRRLIGFRVWRAMHWLSFPVFAMALAHGFGAGTDSGSILAQLLYFATSAILVFLLIFRIMTRSERRSTLTDFPAMPAPYDRFSDVPRRGGAR
jgi:hypothetical protein